MVNSLMIEGIVSFLIGVFLLNLEKYISIYNFKSSVFYLYFGSLILTKNFSSLLILFTVLIGLLFYKNKAFILSTVVYGSYIIYQKNLLK